MSVRTSLTALVVVLMSTSALAQASSVEATRRRALLPYIRSATDCIAREALTEPGVALANKEGRLLPALTGPIKRCTYEVDQMVQWHDRIYQEGGGEEFYRGAYLQDLPRAVVQRIGSELSRKLASEEAQRGAELAEANRRQAEEEQKMARIRAEAEQRAVRQKIDADRLESDRRAEIIRLADIKRQQLETAAKAGDLLKERMYECASREIADMVKSGEGAEVLAAAAMTLCNREVDRALEGLIEAKRIETGATVGSSETEAIKVLGRAAIKERVMASAVKAKAARASTMSP